MIRGDVSDEENGKGRGRTHGDIVVEEEEDPEDDTEREGDANPLGVQLPELHEP